MSATEIKSTSDKDTFKPFKMWKKLVTWGVESLDGSSCMDIFYTISQAKVRAIENLCI